MNYFGKINLEWGNVLTVVGQFSLNPTFLAGMACYVASLILWLIVLSKVDVGLAYPLTSLAYISTAIASYYFFNEPLSIIKMAGIFVIIFGVYLVAKA